MTIGKLVPAALLIVALCGFSFLLTACGKAKIKTRQKVTLLHYWSGTLSGGIDGLVSTFNSNNTDIELIATPLDHEAFKTSIRDTLESGNPPDLYTYWAGARVESLLDKLTPIDDIWSNNNLDSRFSPVIINSACTYQGKKYLIPLTQHYVAFFYNKKVFENAGVQPPSDWNEFLKVCNKLKTKGITPIALGAKPRWPAQFWFDFILLRTAPYTYREKLMQGKARFTDPEVMRTFKIWSELIKGGFFNKEPNRTEWDTGAGDLVYSGKAAMTLMGSWLMGYYNDEKHRWVEGKDYDFFTFPVIDKSIPGCSIGPIDGLVIPADAAQQETAKKVMVFLTEEGPQKEFSKNSGALSPNITIPDSFYTDLKIRIRQDIQKAPNWAFPYDLATPPDEAEVGLNMFAEFLEFPGQYQSIAKRADQEIRELQTK